MVNFINLFKTSTVLFMAVAALASADLFDHKKTERSKPDYRQEKNSNWGDRNGRNMAGKEMMRVEINFAENHLDLSGDQNGNVLEVIVLGSKDFDVNAIEQSSLAIEGVESNGNFVIVDRNNDGIDDLIVAFAVADLELDQGTRELTLKGKTKDGKAFKGSNRITVTKGAAQY